MANKDDDVSYRITAVWENWKPLLSDDADEGFTERGEDLDRAVYENAKTCLEERDSISREILDPNDMILTVERVK